MIVSFEADNFRCFEALRLSNLKRVNIITGENASGKTALLEAIFAAARGTGEGFVVLNQFRGVSIGSTVPGFPMAVVNNDQFQALWNHWFYSKRIKSNNETVTSTATKLAFRYADSDQTTYSCEFGHEPIRPRTTAPQTVPIAISGAPFTFNRTKTVKDQKPVTTQGFMRLGPQGQIQSTRLQELGPATLIFTSSLNYSENENVMWFSQLREAGATTEIVDFFKRCFPFIHNIEVLQPTPGTPAGLYATLASGEVRRLQAVSSGIYKITTILLACARSRDGVVLIDEIENGIFYDKYAITWHILNKFSKTYNCQLFVTSHSAECLHKLVPIIGDDTSDFSLLQTERENGICSARQVTGVAMKAALAGGNEIRGGNGKWASPQ